MSNIVKLSTLKTGEFEIVSIEEHDMRNQIRVMGIIEGQKGTVLSSKGRYRIGDSHFVICEHITNNIWIKVI